MTSASSREENSPSIPVEFESVKLSEEEKETYTASPSDTVIKIFARETFLGSVSSKEVILRHLKKAYTVLPEDEYECIQMILTSSLEDFPVAYYASLSDEYGVKPTFTAAPVEGSFQPALADYGAWEQIKSYIVSPSVLFGDGVTVYRTVCISETYSLNPLGGNVPTSPTSQFCTKIGIYVYYETSIGDYVLFAKQPKTGAVFDTYLFSAEEFFNYSNMIREYNEEWYTRLLGDHGTFPSIPTPEYFGFTSHGILDFKQKFPKAPIEGDSLYEYDQDNQQYILRIFCNEAFFDGSLSAMTVREIASLTFAGSSGHNNRVMRMYYDPSKIVDSIWGDYYRYDTHSYQTKCCETGYDIIWKNKSIWDTLYGYAVEPSMVFGDGVKVESVYCFTADYAEFYDPSGYDYGHGCAIYYVTSAGDFVLYTPNTNEENGPLGALYMFTAEEFFEYTSLLGDECARERREGKTEYTRSLPEALGFASHLLADFTLPTEQAPTPPAPPAEPTPEPVSYVWIPVTAGVLVVLGGACAVFILRRKKN